MIKQELAKYVRRSLLELWPECAEWCTVSRLVSGIDFPEGERLDIRFVFPEEVAEHLGQPIVTAAEKLVQQLPEACRKKYATIEVDSAGEILFGYSQPWLRRSLAKILDAGQQYGRSDIGQQRKVGIDCFAPVLTEPLGMTDARSVWLGAAVSSVLASQGYKLRREWFIHDTDQRLDHLADSVMRRYWQAQGFPVDYPERFMPGEYVKELATSLELSGSMLKDVNQLRQRIRKQVIEGMIERIGRSARQDLHTTFHVMFRESWLIDRGDCNELYGFLERGQLLTDIDGVKSAAVEVEQGRESISLEIQRQPTAAGYEFTYWYERWYQRKFDWLICVSSATREPAADVLAVWLPRLFAGRMATVLSPLPVHVRTSGAERDITDREQLAEVLQRLGHDAARFIILSHPADQSVELRWQVGGVQPELAYKSVQYAFEQMCSILQRKEVRYAKLGATQSTLEHPAERELLARLLQYPDLLAEVSHSLEVWRVAMYATRLAEAYEAFARLCPLFGEHGLDATRLEIMKATRLVMSLGFKILGLGQEEETPINTN